MPKGEVAIYGAASSVSLDSTTAAAFTFDSVIREDSIFDHGTLESDFELGEAGHYLVAYTLATDRGDTNSIRTELLSELKLDGSSIAPYGSASSYTRRETSGEAGIQSAATIIDVATADDVLNVMVSRTDTSTTANIDSLTAKTGLSLLKLDDSVGYFRAARTATTVSLSAGGNNPSGLSTASLSWTSLGFNETADEHSTGYFTHSTSTNPHLITLRSNYRHLVCYSVKFNNTGSARLNGIARLMLDSAEVYGSMSTAYARTTNGTHDPVASGCCIIEPSGTNKILWLQAAIDAESTLTDLDVAEVAIAIYPIRAEYDTVRLREDAAHDHNSQPPDPVDFTVQDQIDTASFTHSTTVNPSQLEFEESGDYLLIGGALMVKTSATNGSRKRPELGFLDNGGSTEMTPGGACGFCRGDQSSTGTWFGAANSAVLFEGASGEYVEMSLRDRVQGGEQDTDFLANETIFQALRIISPVDGSGGSVVQHVASAGTGTVTAPAVSGSGASEVQHVESAGSGTVTDPAISGSGASEVQHATSAGSGAITFSGSGASEVQHATSAGQGSVATPEPRTGSGASVVQHVVSGGTGVVTPPTGITGTGASVVQHLTSAGSGSLSFEGSGASLVQHVTSDGYGLVAFLTIFGSGASEVQPVESAGTGALSFIGSGASIVEHVTSAGTGVNTPPAGTIGSGASAVQHVTSAGTGAVGAPPITGSGASAVEHVTSGGSGTVAAPPAITGTGASLVEIVTSSGAGALSFEGSGASVVQHVTSAGSGNVGAQVLIFGSGASVVEHVESAGVGIVGTPPVTGSGASEVQSITSAGAGAVTFSGAGASTVEHVTSAGAGSLGFSGSGASEVESVTSAGSGVVTAAGTVGSGASEVQHATSAGAGTVRTPAGVSGSGASAVQPVSSAGSGVLTFSGSAASVVQHVSSAGTGVVTAPSGVVGSGASVVQHATSAGSGTVTAPAGITGAGASRIEPVSSAGVGSLGFIGAGASEVQPITSAGVGYVFEDSDVCLPRTIEVRLPSTNIDVALPDVNVDVPLPGEGVDVILSSANIDVILPSTDISVSLPSANIDLEVCSS